MEIVENCEGVEACQSVFLDCGEVKSFFINYGEVSIRASIIPPHDVEGSIIFCEVENVGDVLSGSYTRI